jgi:hypothetical protein
MCQEEGENPPNPESNNPDGTGNNEDGDKPNDMNPIPESKSELDMSDMVSLLFLNHIFS